MRKVGKHFIEVLKSKSCRGKYGILGQTKEELKLCLTLTLQMSLHNYSLHTKVIKLNAHSEWKGKRLYTYQFCNKITNTISAFTIMVTPLSSVPFVSIPKFKYYEWKCENIDYWRIRKRDKREVKGKLKS